MQVRAERGEESWAASAGPRGCAIGPRAGMAARERALAKNWAGMVLVLGRAARWGMATLETTRARFAGG